MSALPEGCVVGLACLKIVFTIVHHCLGESLQATKFFLNVFTEFAEFSDKNTVKGPETCYLLHQ